MTLLNKPVGATEKTILNVLSDKKLRTFSELKKETGLSGPTVSENLKLLQKRNMVKKDIDSRKYGICTEGIQWLKREGLTDTIKSGIFSEDKEAPPPASSIVAIDVPNLTEVQKRTLLDGTVNIAKVCFNQFLIDIIKESASHEYPTSGRIVYTAAIDLREVEKWRNSDEGKKYFKEKSL